MAESRGEREKRLDQLRRAVLKPGFDRHASVLKGLADLPPELGSPALTALTSSQVIETIIDFPPQIQNGWQYVPRQALLFTPTGVIHLLASIWPEQQPRVTNVNGGDLMYMKVKLLLLYGFLEIVARGETSPTRLGVEFNTVAWPHLSAPLQRLLRAAKSAPVELTTRTGLSLTTQQAVEKLPLKFSNGLRIYGLLPGEGLEEVVFQPTVWKRWLLFFWRPVIANTLLLLTSNYIVVIQEELGISQGWILSYIPRACITGMCNQPRDLCDELIVQLKRGDQTTEYRLLLSSTALEAWGARWTQPWVRSQTPESAQNQ